MVTADAEAHAIFEHGDLYFADHNPPHFHVLGGDGAAQVAIETLEVIAVNGKIDLREALEWAADNKPLLLAKWNELSGS